jgi:hypothetical protein
MIKSESPSKTFKKLEKKGLSWVNKFRDQLGDKVDVDALSKKFKETTTIFGKDNALKN